MTNKKTTSSQEVKLTVDGLNPLNMSDADMKFAREEMQKIYSEDKALWDKAFEVVKQLGNAGLWRGMDASMLIVANAIRGSK